MRVAKLAILASSSGTPTYLDAGQLCLGAPVHAIHPQVLHPVHGLQPHADAIAASGIGGRSEGRGNGGWHRAPHRRAPPHARAHCGGASETGGPPLN
jgi:hypothetical protein